jgi:hypothetical protein
MHNALLEPMTIDDSQSRTYWLELDVQGDRYTERDIVRWARGEIADIDEHRRLAIIDVLLGVLNDVQAATLQLRDRGGRSNAPQA